MSTSRDAAGEAMGRLVPAVLDALAVLEHAARHLDPDTLQALTAAIGTRGSQLGPALEAARALHWPEGLAPVRDCLVGAAEAAQRGLMELSSAMDAPDPLRAAFRAVRSYAPACEALYPLAAFLTPVGRFFLTEHARDDTALIASLAARPGQDGTGTMAIGGPPGTRGGASLYVPEYHEPSRPWPLIVALHGGSGDGRAFLWNWLREARSRGCILLAPTATGRTWSLQDPAQDGANITRLVAQVAKGWSVDPSRMLLTGMSDGGTFSYLHGLGAEAAYSHVAPVAAAFHPIMVSITDPARLRGLPVFILHGERDWMFPPETAERAADVLAAAGAAVRHEEIPDLAHAYPREANAAILDWFLGA
ncbi:phospholipase [Roseomonas eburnea]|uniref:Phospholipase n=1 Tax=Neoroseomonas eburnea TaxID=1346889 RepID=A0A9X9XIP5_9PROT|nr:dienelactone hydrolase family protein [Neoroseomonas eburnea]MBR0683581.1 phospholipase [Neoroseomonas eburnea]